MALFNNIFFNTGFLYGLNNWFTPTLMFCNPVRSFGIFNFINGLSVWNNNDFRFNLPETSADNKSYKISSDINQTDFQTNNSVWSNYAFDFSKISDKRNFDSFDFSGIKNMTATKAAEEADSEKTSAANKNSSTVSYGKTSKCDTRQKYSAGASGKIDYKYADMYRSAALELAAKDPNLEDLRTKQYSGWLLKNTFATDIPFAKKGTAKILQKVYEMTGIKLEISSALGTNGNGSGSPHQKNNGYSSHHNAENPKLDISYSSIGNSMSGEDFAAKLRSTGLFNWILVEGDHLDVQIHPDAYAKYA